MNILVVTRELPPVGGGAGYVALNLAETMAQQGHHLHVVTMHFGELPVIEKRGRLTIYRIRCGRKNQDSSYLFEMIRFVFSAIPVARRLVNSEQCLLIHAHAIIPDALIALCVRGRRPFVITAHGSDVPGYNPDQFTISHRILRPVWHAVLNSAAEIVTPSSFLASLIKRVRPDQGVARIPNGVADNFFRADPHRVGFLIVSRLVKRKNYHLFLKALGKIPEPQSVDIVGDGPALEDLKMLASECPHHSIRFHGWLPNGSSKWKRLYESSRFLVFPSASENFPINLLEGLAAGVLVLASDIPSNREVLEHDAVYFPSLSIEDIAATICEVLKMSDETWMEKSAEGMHRVQQEFSWEAVTSRYLALYESILSKTDS